MLSAPHRLRSGVDLRRVSRRGRRCAGDTVVVHLLLGGPAAPDGAGAAPRVGFVVGRTVGNSVERHRVQRRLRHLCRDRLHLLPPGTELVVRALAAAGTATYAELGTDLDRCLQRALGAGPGTVS